MNRNDIDTNTLYSGKDILNFTMNEVFIEGDKLIAIQDDDISRYIYKKTPNGSFDFFDEQYNDSPLDMFDLVNCKFIISFNEDKYSSISDLIFNSGNTVTAYDRCLS